MSWLSVGARFLSAVAVVPLLVTRFTAAEVALWFLLATLVGLQQLADMGFAPTFVRAIAYAMGGASDLKSGRLLPGDVAREPRWDLIERIWNTMRVVYTRLTLAALALFAIGGTIALRRPVAALEDPTIGWACWAIVVATFVISIQGNRYAVYLQGTGHIGVLRRWEALTAIAGALTSVAAILSGGGLLALVLANQVWVVLYVVRDRWLSRTVNGARLAAFVRAPHSPEILHVVWESALFSGLGILFSRGVLLSSGLVYAQVADSAALAAYLIAFRVMQTLLDFSNAPFYSRIPDLARLHAAGDQATLADVARRGMRLSYWTFATGVVAAGVAVPWLLALLHSSVQWPPDITWALLGVAFLVERFGAMHIQLYSTTNHIIWHKANGVSGTLYLILSLALLPTAGVNAFPLAILLAYLAFYSWYAPLHVYRTFRFDFWEFQRQTVLLPGSVIVLYSLSIFALGSR
jgi:hypothetical protein